MKVRLIDKEPAKKEWQYPCCGERGDLVVLFTHEDRGTVLVADGVWWVGYYDETWKMGTFTPIYDKDILIET